jgi:hypothetical protein
MKTTNDAISEQTYMRDEQSPVFICEKCKHWEIGTVGCRKNYFIAVVGAHIPNCMGFEGLMEVKDELSN